MSKKSSKPSKSKKTDEQKQLESYFYFCSPVYKMNISEFVEAVSQVAEEHAVEIRKQGIDEIYPVVQTGNLLDDPRILDFGNFIAQTAWNVLSSQGYDMQNFTTHFSEMWMQEHYKHSAMEEHMHKGVDLVGFYMLEVPENSSKVVFYDPRPGKVMGSRLPELDVNAITIASDAIHFDLQPGDLLIAPAWLPHAFTRHGSDKPIRFVHFNVFAQPAVIAPPQPPAEVI